MTEYACAGMFRSVPLAPPEKPPVFLPEESHGGPWWAYGPQGCKESETTNAAYACFQGYIGGGRGLLA